MYFLNSETHLEHVTDASTIQECFDTVQPSGSTPCAPPHPQWRNPAEPATLSTGLQLDEILRPYIESLEDAKVSKAKIKPMVVVVLTDGRADDSDLVREVSPAHCREVTAH